MGLRYLGPIDGHDLPLLISTLEFAKTCDQPIVIHVLTKKGKGYEAALKNPEKFHGLGPYDVATGATPASQAGHAAQLPGRLRPGHGEALPEGQAAWSASPPPCPAAPA